LCAPRTGIDQDRESFFIDAPLQWFSTSEGAFDAAFPPPVRTGSGSTGSSQHQQRCAPSRLAV